MPLSPPPAARSRNRLRRAVWRRWWRAFPLPTT